MEERIQIGVQTEVQTFNVNADFSLGTGQTFTAWLRIPLREKHFLGLAVAYRQLQGYQQENQELTTLVQPTRVFEVFRADQLIGLNYLDLNLSWNSSLRAKKRVAWGGGVKLAILNGVRGKRSLSTVITEYSLESPEDPLRQYIASFAKQTLGRRGFATLDIGVFTQLNYELMQNLDFTAAYYQGVINVFGKNRFSEQKTHYLSQFSLGLSARIF